MSTVNVHIFEPLHHTNEDNSKNIKIKTMYLRTSSLVEFNSSSNVEFFSNERRSRSRTLK